MSLKRALYSSASEEDAEMDIGAATSRTYTLLNEGKYMDSLGREMPVKGGLSKLLQAKGLSNVERALIKAYHCMITRIPGTRDVYASLCAHER